MMRNTNYEEMDLIALPSSTLITEDNVSELNEKLKSVIAEKYDRELKTVEITRGSELEKNIRNSIIDYINENNIIFRTNNLKLKVIEDFMIGLSGYGILQPLMDDDEIEEIYVYAPDKIWYLKDGKNVLSDIRFDSSEKLKSYIDNALGRIGRTLNNANPIEDGRLPDGSRIAVSASTLSPNGYTMNIRKFRKERITLDRMIEFGSMDEEIKKLLVAIINARLNFLVSGGTASGKTTLLNAMSQYIPENENVESVEDNIELQLNREFWLQLETRKANLEGEGEITMADLLVHILRRSPERIIVGEIRTPQVADTFMNAIQTGHDGVCATIHANDPKRCRARMSKLASTANNTPYNSNLDDFDHSIHIIIQMKRDEIARKRVITSIDFVSDNSQMINLVEYNRKDDRFIHKKLPQELKELFYERGVEYEE
jgi:pilus assembly protein CpaF